MAVAYAYEAGISSRAGPGPRRYNSTSVENRSRPVNTVPPTAALPAQAGDPTQAPSLERELAELMVQALNLEVAPAAIVPTAPLFGDGLGLDSIDVLEIALEVSRRYGFELRADDENNVRIFSSLRALAAHVAARRTR
jgi:acyl carrier protein